MINFFYPTSRITYDLNMVNNDYDLHVIKYAIESYGFIVQKKISLTLSQFAEEIKRCYDVIHEPHNREVYRVLTKQEYNKA